MISLVEATCPFCGQNALGVSPTLALAALVVHLSEQVADNEHHNWESIKPFVMIYIETGVADTAKAAAKLFLNSLYGKFAMPTDGTRHPILYGNSYD